VRGDDDWVGAVKAWHDCSAIDGWRAIEVEMMPVEDPAAEPDAGS
jgi:hypothetical protein